MTSGTYRSIGSIVGLAALGVSAYALFQGYIIPGLLEILQPETRTRTGFALIWVPVISYLLIAGCVSLVVSIFKQPKKWHEDGLLTKLCDGFLLGILLSILGLDLLAITIGLTIGLALSVPMGLFKELT